MISLCEMGVVKPCPFCGSTKVNFDVHMIGHHPYYTIVCEDCSYETSRMHSTSEAEEEWNSK